MEIQDLARDLADLAALLTAAFGYLQNENCDPDEQRACTRILLRFAMEILARDQDGICAW